MIEPTDEMVTAAATALNSSLDAGNEWPLRDVVVAVLAILERDYSVRPRRPEWPLHRGGSHPHYCVSCSDGVTRGTGCINCRTTGFDQTPWPDCAGCRS